MTLLRSFLLALICLCAATPLHAQEPDRLLHARLSEGELELLTAQGRYRIRPLSEQVLQTQFQPWGEPAPGPSHTVPAELPRVDAQLRRDADGLWLRTAGIAVQVLDQPLRLRYVFQGQELLQQVEGFHAAGEQQRVRFRISADEALMGGGARALGMNRRGHRLKLYNRAHYGYGERSGLMSTSLPLVLSSKRYLVHFDDGGVGELDLARHDPHTLAYETSNRRRTYQVVAAPHWEGLLAAYTGLTGRQPLPPRWALGSFASRFGYRSEAQAREVLAHYRAADIPLDAIVFDLYWFGKTVTGTMGNLAFDRDTFPDPAGMMRDFAAQGVQTVLITEPFILKTSQRWDEAVREGVLATDASGQPASYDFFFGHTGLIDLFKPQARDWFWARYRELKSLGVGGWWGDLGEPEVHPAHLRHASGSADEVHNQYGHEWARLIHEGYRRDYPNERPFILMRAGFSGSQRFGLIPWSGDVARSWAGLSSQPEIALQMGLQGLAYMHSDLGGFAGAHLDDELYVRWLQYGVFQPVFRPHAQDEVPSEPVYRAAPALALARAAIQLRARLLPYHYSMAFENSRSGLPLMRPLWFAEPENAALYREANTYFWGPSLLVAPVLQAGQATRSVYLPGTRAYFDFHTGQRHAGGQTLEVALQSDRIPVFVRAGAFLPLATRATSVRDYDARQLELHHYVDASAPQAEGELYDDDGHTAQAYEQGRYERLRFQSRLSAQGLTLDLTSHPGAQWAPHSRRLDLQIHGLKAAPRAVRLNGKALADWRWDSGRLHFSVPTQPGGRQRVQVQPGFSS